MRSSLSQPAQATGTGGACRSNVKALVTLHRCPQQQHVASCSVSSKLRGGVGVAAAAAAVAAPVTPTAAEPESVAEQQVEPQAAASQQNVQRSRNPRNQKQQRREGDEEGAEPGAIIVLDKPVTNSIVRRLAEVPQAVLRAGRPDDATTYRAVAAVASAQKQLAASNKVAVYVPYTKAARFTAQLLTADASILDTITTTPLTVRASTDAAALGNTLAFTLLREGGATVASAGASATAKAAEGLRVARALLLKKGFEIGVVPRFADSIGNQGQQITILRQEVVSKEMPPPEVVAPSNPSKPLAPTAAAAATLLARQRRCTLKVRQGQMFRLTELLFTTAQPKGRAPAAPAAAAVAAEATEPDTAAAAAPQAAAGADAGSGRDGNTREAEQAMKPRLLLVSYMGTLNPPPAASTASSSSSNKSQDTPAALDAAAAPDAAAGGDATAIDDSAPAAAEAEDAATKQPSAAAAEVPGSAFVTLDLQRSRFTTIPEPRWGLAGPGGPLYAKKPVVVTADSSAVGVAGALESKLYRLGAAWLYTDGSVVGNRTAWEAYASLGRKLAGKANKSAVLALVKIEQEQGSSKGQGSSSSSREGKAGAEQQPQQEDVEGSQQQQQVQGGKQQQQKGAGYRLSMLIVHDEDVQRSIMQAPNAPLESSRVAFKQALQLIKFTAAVNCFLPVSEASGTGGLVLLPAVLPAATAAVDYRFAGTDRAQGAAYDYYFRVQRLTSELPQGLAGPEVQQLRVSPGTDPSKLRDAIVAKMLTGQPATLRFAAPAGLIPDFLLSVAMTAVAAARVRLQAKGAAVDVAVMPLVLQDSRGPSSKGAEGAEGGESWGARGGERQGGKGPRESKSVVYSLRLVPMPAAVADEAQMPLVI